MKIETEFELEFINRFVVKNKRERLIGFASKPKSRNKMFNEFRSPEIFDPRYVTEILGSDRNTDILANIYKKHGMSGRVYVMSENEEWDAQRFQMSYIVDECMAMCIDTIGYCWKSKTAFYEWHHSGASYFLKCNDKT